MVGKGRAGREERGKGEWLTVFKFLIYSLLQDGGEKEKSKLFLVLGRWKIQIGGEGEPERKSWKFSIPAAVEGSEAPATLEGVEHRL